MIKEVLKVSYPQMSQEDCFYAILIRVRHILNLLIFNFFVLCEQKLSNSPIYVADCF